MDSYASPELDWNEIAPRPRGPGRGSERDVAEFRRPSDGRPVRASRVFLGGPRCVYLPSYAVCMGVNAGCYWQEARRGNRRGAWQGQPNGLGRAGKKDPLDFQDH